MARHFIKVTVLFSNYDTLGNPTCYSSLHHNAVCLSFYFWYITFPLYPVHRIVQVDLKFPPKPIVSSAAKDLISQVSFVAFITFNIQITTKIPSWHILNILTLLTDACQGFFPALATP